MKLNYLAFAVPVFILLMLAEFLIAKRKGKNYFNFTNSITNINVGIAERLLDTLVTGLFFFVYDYLHRHFAILHISPSVLLWIALFICTDFTWYWYHRLAHEVNLFWAAHIVHHQSEDFNYTVSARITVFQAILRTAFWSVLPIIGFPAEMIVSVLLVHGLYPFFIHTRLIGKLGILEYILVTPSHHRVHHASNPVYLDKNYGDVLIIWDKLFGSFAKEKEEVVFGLTKPLKTHSFLWQHFHFLMELVCAVRMQKGLFNRLSMLFGKPEIIDPAIRNQLEKKFHIRNHEDRQENQLNQYVVWQVISSLAILFLFILFEHHFSWQLQSLVACFIIITLVNCGAILEQRQWIFYLEYSRGVIMSSAIILYYPSISIAASVMLIMAITLYYFNRLEHKYLGFVYREQLA